MDTIFKFLHSIMFTLTLQISKLTKAVVLNSFPHGRFRQFVYKENVRDRRTLSQFFSNEVSFVWELGGFELSRLEKNQNRTLKFVNKSLKMHLIKRHKIEWNIVLISFESVYCTIVLFL